MDDALEAKYEAHPWRTFVIEAKSGKLLADTGLSPFNMDAKLALFKKALEWRASRLDMDLHGARVRACHVSTEVGE